MPYARPTLTDLRTQVLNDVNSARITDASGNVLIGLLQKAFLRVIANVQAGMAYEHYGFIDYISLQAVPFTATDEFLDGWANLKGVVRKPAIPTVGSASFAATAGTIPAGSTITRSDNVTYTTNADASVVSGSITPTFTATIPGSAANFDDGTTVFVLANPISGVQSTSTASTSTQITAGADLELDASLRTRMLLAYSAPPQGGDRSDYIEFALAVPGVTRAWVAPNAMGPGTVSVFFMMDQSEAAFGGFPQGTNGVAANEPRSAAATGDQLTVANAIFPLQPVTALVFAIAPTPQPVAFTISNLGANNTATMQALIQAALTDMFVRLGQAGGTVNPETGAAFPGIEPSDWYAASEAVPGLSEFDVPVPSSEITPASGALLTLGTVTFQS